MSEPAYKVEDVLTAHQSGLLSDDDRDYLLNALGTQPSMTSGLAGAAAGALGGAALGGFAGKATRNMLKGDGTEQLGPMADWMTQKMPDSLPGMLANRSQGAMAGAGLGGGLGAMGGGVGGAYAMGEPGEGVGGEDASQRDMLLRALIDPNVPAREKKKILEMLQSSQEAMAAAQEGQGGGMDWQSMLGGAVGAGAAGLGGALLGGAGNRALQNAAQGMGEGWGKSAASMASQDIPLPQFMQSANLKSIAPMGVAGGIAGGGAGAFGGDAAANALQSRFSDPFAEQEVPQ
jgi:hypothetical protein